MEKTIALALNNFSTIPLSLRERPAVNLPKSQIEVSLASLYHHYYLDSYGRLPPDPDPAQFEYLRFLSPTSEFRIQGTGLGISSTFRRHTSNELGQAFCRWFLHDHLNITYFAHIEHVLKRSMQGAFSNYQIERTASGDTPDYFCAEDVAKIFLAEAKGRYSSVSFKNTDFAKWRSQFSRVVVKDSNGTALSVKGYIVATRFGTENKPNVKSGIFAEDPSSPGEIPIPESASRAIGPAVISTHYSDIALKLGQTVLASALSYGYIVPEQIQFPVTIWEFQMPPLQGRRFVGGYFSPTGDALPAKLVNNRVVFDAIDPFRIDVGQGTFIGLDEKIFRQLATVARQGYRATAEIQQFDQIQAFYSAVSVLRDGSIIGPLELFTPVERVAI